MAASTPTFAVKTNLIQSCIEEYSNSDDLKHHIELPYNFGVINITMPVTTIRTVPFHILFSLDNSGSMTSDLENVKDTLYNILEYLLYQDVTIYVSVQYFNSCVKSITTNTLLTEESLSLIKSQSSRVTANGMTNIETAFAQVHSTYQEDATNIHIFMTDGEPTVGSAKPHILCEYLPSTFEHYYLGFNASHNAKILYDLCTKTDGHYYFVDTPENSGLIYGEILHKFLYRAKKLRLKSDGAISFYDYKINKWVSTYDYGCISSDDTINIHFKFDWQTPIDQLYFTIVTFNIDNIDETETHYPYNLSTQDCVYNPTTITDQTTRSMDVEKYYYRQKVLETLYTCLQQRRYTTDIISNIETLFENINTFTERNELNNDSFMQQLKDDLSMVHTTSQSGDAFDTPYCLARHVSQGSQQAYNVSNLNMMNHGGVGVDTYFDRSSLLTPSRRTDATMLPAQPPMLLHQNQFSFTPSAEDPVYQSYTPGWGGEIGPPNTPSILRHVCSRDSTSAYATPHQTQVMETITQDCDELS